MALCAAKYWRLGMHVCGMRDPAKPLLQARPQWLMWLLAVAGGLIVTALIVRRVLRPQSTSDIDVGNVSDGWLAEQKGRKTDSVGEHPKNVGPNETGQSVMKHATAEDRVS